MAVRYRVAGFRRVSEVHRSQGSVPCARFSDRHVIQQAPSVIEAELCRQVRARPNLDYRRMPHINVDFRFIEIEYELWALDHLRATLEDQISYLRDQDTLKTFAELREHGWEHDEAERQIAAQELDERQDYVLPRFLRGPFVVSLWACYESAVRELADYFRRVRQAKLELRDIRADNELLQFKKYYRDVLSVSLDDVPDRLAFMDDLRLVRNAIAHANGQRRAMTAGKWNMTAEALARRGVTVDDYRGVIVLTDAFLREAYDTTNVSLRALVARARSA